jgi:hypothetical protein
MASPRPAPSLAERISQSREPRVIRAVKVRVIQL